MSLEFFSNPELAPEIVQLGDLLSIIPSHPKFLSIARSMSGFPADRVLEARDKLREIAREHNYVIIDLSPQMYYLTAPMIAASNYLASPVTKTGFSLDAVRYLVIDMIEYRCSTD